MKVDKLLLYAVTDRREKPLDGFLVDVEAAMKGGITIIQLREKNLSDDEFIEEGKRVRALCDKYNVPLIINDNIRVAMEVNADGIHVGQEDMPAREVRAIIGSDRIVGVSARTVEEALKAQNDGADYIGVGAVFSTNTKDDARVIGVDGLKKICEAVDIPVVAIGGINSSNIYELRDTAIKGAAISGGIFRLDNIEGGVKVLKEEMNKKEMNKEKMNMATEGLRKVERACALTIAGSDSSGGAGIQADLKTMLANGVYGMSAITALTAQNTMGVTDIMESTPEFLRAQLDAVFTDIFPDGIKIGMVASTGLIMAIKSALVHYNAKNIVVDPVMVATSGSRLISEDAIDCLCNELLPISTVITPNILEAQIIADMDIRGPEDMEEAARRINSKYGCAVLVKGGHSINDANDYLFDGERGVWFEGERINNPNTHGTGCTLSSAIASNLAKGMNLENSVREAKKYISGALRTGLNLGRGRGPLEHGYVLD